MHMELKKTDTLTNKYSFTVFKTKACRNIDKQHIYCSFSIMYVETIKKYQI